MAPTTRPVVFMDINIGETPAGRMKMELYSDIVPKYVIHDDHARFGDDETNVYPRTAENFRQLCTGEYRYVFSILHHSRALVTPMDSVNSRPQGFKNATFHRYGFRANRSTPLTLILHQSVSKVNLLPPLPQLKLRKRVPNFMCQGGPCQLPYLAYH